MERDIEADLRMAVGVRNYEAFIMGTAVSIVPVSPSLLLDAANEIHELRERIQFLEENQTEPGCY